MAIRTLLNNKTDGLGKSNPVTCPVCNRKTEMELFSNYDTDNYIGKLLGKDKEFNFAVCPLCTSVFKVNMSSYGIENSPLREYHLITLKSSKDE